VSRITSRKYEIRSGRRTVSIQSSCSAMQAAVDYVRSFGTPDSEITRLGVAEVAWRGARFTAVAVPDEPPAPASPAPVVALAQPLPPPYAA
jgi:hypothetical protein